MKHDIITSNDEYGGIAPVQFGYEKCKNSYFYGPIARTYHLFHFVESGFGIFRINGKEYRVGPGEIFVIPPYTETYYEADKINPWTYTWIGFTAEKKLPLKLPDVIRCPEASEVFNSMKNATGLNNGRNSFLISKIWELFSILLENKKSNASYVDKALDYIHSEYMYDITIDKIAAWLGLDHSYFSSLFKKKMGLSPKQYLLNYRMNVALSLMSKNNISVSVAAYSVGYTDICNFSKMFKKTFGVSPVKYMQLMKNK
jgi:AraC-like DNA-binding protein